MAEGNGKRLINPVLTFLKRPAPAPIKGGGKNEKDIRQSRLATQRKKLSESFDGFMLEAKKIKHMETKPILLLVCLVIHTHPPGPRKIYFQASLVVELSRPPLTDIL